MADASLPSSTKSNNAPPPATSNAAKAKSAKIKDSVAKIPQGPIASPKQTATARQATNVAKKEDAHTATKPASQVQTKTAKTALSAPKKDIVPSKITLVSPHPIQTAKAANDAQGTDIAQT
jgi:hypothetical protein